MNLNNNVNTNYFISKNTFSRILNRNAWKLINLSLKLLN